MNTFPYRMAWRETRAAWRHFLYFLACIAMGVGGVTSVSLFGVNVERAVTREARSLLGGDVEVRLSRAPGEEGAAELASLTSRAIVISHASELVGMAAVRGSGSKADHINSQLVELKAVEATYPLYGSLVTSPQAPLSTLLEQTRQSSCRPVCYGALVQDSFLIRMGLDVGSNFQIGEASFVVTGIIRKEPDRMANMFSLGPRVMISQDALKAAQLVKPGGRVRERYLLKVPPTIDVLSLQQELRGRMAGDSARIASYREAQPQLKQFLEQLAQYLGLVGLTALFVGGIGVATSVQAFLREKLQSIAVLKILGADTRTVLQSYLGQAVGLGLVGSLIGIVLGIALQTVLPMAVARLLELNVLDQMGFSTALGAASLFPILKGLALGLLTTLLFTLWPLLTVRAIKPAVIFRRDVETASGAGAGHGVPFSRWWASATWRDRPRVWTVMGIAVGLAGLSMWQAGSVKIGAIFIAGLLVAVLFLVTASQLLLVVLRKLPTPRWVSLRQAVGNIIRPGSHAVSIMLSVGVGVMVMVAVAVIEQSLVRQVRDNRPTDAPTFFFIDIQPDQAASFTSLLHERTGDPAPALTPLIRSRLRAINGQPIAADADGENQADAPKEERRKNWYLTREYVLTFLEDLPKDNHVVKGSWWKKGERFSEPLVSVEEDAARHLGLDIGSIVELDIQGVAFQAKVSSVRKVEWGNFSTNFYMIVSPGALDGAPFTYVATVRVPPSEEATLQRAVVAAFPNVTALNIADVLDSFARILDRVSLAIRAVAMFCVFAGALVMATALTATRYRRLYDAVILKALGATRGVLSRAFAAEYLIVGAVAGTIGAGLATLLSWAAIRLIFDLPWVFHPGPLVTGLGLAMLLTLMVGFLSTFRILGQRPLAVLRHE